MGASIASSSSCLKVCPPPAGAAGDAALGGGPCATAMVPGKASASASKQATARTTATAKGRRSVIRQAPRRGEQRPALTRACEEAPSFPDDDPGHWFSYS